MSRSPSQGWCLFSYYSVESLSEVTAVSEEWPPYLGAWILILWTLNPLIDKAATEQPALYRWESKFMLNKCIERLLEGASSTVEYFTRRWQRRDRHNGDRMPSAHRHTVGVDLACSLITMPKPQQRAKRLRLPRPSKTLSPIPRVTPRFSSWVWGEACFDVYSGCCLRKTGMP